MVQQSHFVPKAAVDPLLLNLKRIVFPGPCYVVSGAHKFTLWCRSESSNRVTIKTSHKSIKHIHQPIFYPKELFDNNCLCLGFEPQNCDLVSAPTIVVRRLHDWHLLVTLPAEQNLFGIDLIWSTFSPYADLLLRTDNALGVIEIWDSAFTYLHGKIDHGGGSIIASIWDTQRLITLNSNDYNVCIWNVPSATLHASFYVEGAKAVSVHADVLSFEIELNNGMTYRNVTENNGVHSAIEHVTKPDIWTVFKNRTHVVGYYNENQLKADIVTCKGELLGTIRIPKSTASFSTFLEEFVVVLAAGWLSLWSRNGSVLLYTYLGNQQFSSVIETGPGCLVVLADFGTQRFRAMISLDFTSAVIDRPQTIALNQDGVYSLVEQQSSKVLAFFVTIDSTRSNISVVLVMGASGPSLLNHVTLVGDLKELTNTRFDFSILFKAMDARHYLELTILFPGSTTVAKMIRNTDRFIR